MRSYKDLICEKYTFPTNDFAVKDDCLTFSDIDLMDIIKRHGTPLTIHYLPRISQNISKAREVFSQAIKQYKYPENYIFCYCTKASHFKFVMEECLKNKVSLETSSVHDMLIIEKLYKENKIEKDAFVVCNGFKPPAYKAYICNMINKGFKQIMPVLDNTTEIDYYTEHIKENFMVGIRYATDEETNYEFYTSRLGIRGDRILSLFKEKIEKSKNIRLRMLHFFINTGIRDSAYYWSEFSKFIYTYCALRKDCPYLDMINIGGGFPAMSSLDFSYDYQEMANLIIETIQDICKKNDTPCPKIVTEFGTFTVGESAANIYSVVDVKSQNDKELWYMIDGSLMTQLPDSWAIGKKFPMLAINNWDKQARRVNIGGMTCDGDDFYASDVQNSRINLPIQDDTTPQYIGFFYTGAYQAALSGFGGVQHCLIPRPKQLILKENEKGELVEKIFSEEQSGEAMLKLLGY